MSKTLTVAEAMFDHAKSIVEDGRELVPMFFFCGDDRPTAIIPTPWRNSYEKGVAYDMVRGILARDLTIEGYISITEAWMANVDPSDPDPLSVRPSQRANRIEVINVVIGERNGRMMHWFAEIKTENGKRSVCDVKKFGEQSNQQFSGDLACLFPSPSKGAMQ